MMQYRPARLFVVDDDPDIRFATARLMRSADYEVFEIATGEECLQQAQEKHPDLILLDVVLPGLDGIEVCRQIKTNPDLADIYVVLLSSLKTSSSDQVEGLEVGADNYISRPIPNRELLARVQAMLRLKQSEAKRLRLALEAGRLGTWDYDLVTNTVSWDQRSRAIFGFALNKALTFEKATGVIHPDDLDRTKRVFNEAIAPASAGSYEVEKRVVWPDESIHWVVARGQTLFEGEGDQRRPVQLVGVIEDVTERKQVEAEREQLLGQLQEERAQLKLLTETLEEQVAKRTEEVQALATALSLAEEQERKRLAQTLHDDLQQALYSQLLKLKILRDKYQGDDLPSLNNEINDIIQGLDQAINMTRSLAVELSPPVLKEATFPEALQWLVDHMEKEHFFKFHLSVQGHCHVHNQHLQTLLLQMIRELLFNVVKHAGTNQGRIHVWQEDKSIMIRIEDEGKGFDVKAVRAREKQRGKFGLSSVEQRLALIGGRLEIASEPGRGTQMTLIAPME